MSETFSDSVQVTHSGATEIELDASLGDVTLGGGGQSGDLVLKDAKGTTRVHISASSGSLIVWDASGRQLANLGPNGNLTLGGDVSDGDVTLKDGDGQTRIAFDAQHNRIRVRDAEGKQLVDLGPNGNLALGGDGHDGDIALEDASGQNRINLDAQAHRMIMRDADGNTVVDLGKNGNLVLGGSSMDGDLICKSTDGVETIHLDGQNGNIRLGGTGHDGDLTLRNASNNETIHLNGDSGDIILKNADFAEEFDVDLGVQIQTGALMVLDEKGELVPCSKAHDQRVVGVVAGAGNYRPGIVMDRQTGNGHRAPIAMLGKVACQADATGGPIRVGDLLTTSSTPGHAMRVGEGAQAAGTVIGKALSSLESGQGWVNVFVNLQ